VPSREHRVLFIDYSARVIVIDYVFASKCFTVKWRNLRAKKEASGERQQINRGMNNLLCP